MKIKPLKYAPEIYKIHKKITLCNFIYITKSIFKKV